MEALNIMVELPAAIAEGLKSGAYERIGGVVREVQSGRVVAWLRDVGDQAKRAKGALPSGLPGGLGEAAVGLQVLNTGIMVAGFAMLANRISAVSQQCEHILRHSVETNHRLEWLQKAGIT